jgi:hypothetical protein
MVIVKASKASEAGVLPSAELLTAMGKFNQELIKAGVMLTGDGLQASSKGARVKFTGDKRIVTDGPFAETKEFARRGDRMGYALSQSHAGRRGRARNSATVRSRGFRSGAGEGMKQGRKGGFPQLTSIGESSRAFYAKNNSLPLVQ